jgi:hypothetical protein
MLGKLQRPIRARPRGRHILDDGRLDHGGDLVVVYSLGVAPRWSHPLTKERAGEQQDAADEAGQAMELRS